MHLLADHFPGISTWRLRLPGTVCLLLLALGANAFTAADDGFFLPTGKRISPAAVHGQQTNSFPVTMALSPDKHWLAILNNGYGTRESGLAQSIAVLDLKTNKLVDFPDMPSIPATTKSRPRSSYFLGLAFSGDGKKLYASIGSISDPLGKQTGDRGNGIAVYSFHEGVVKPETFWPIPLQKLAAGKRQAAIWSGTPKGMAIPYPAGLAVVHFKSSERLLVADNLSDDALLLDARDGRVLRRFDLSTGDNVPATYPCAVAVSKDGTRAWVSLWNTSSVGEIDLAAGKVVGRGSLFETASPTDASAHPTALLLSDDDKRLFICFSNEDSVAEIEVDTGRLIDMINVTPPGQRSGGTFPTALALSKDGTQLFVSLASSNAVAVVSVDPMDITHNKPYGFIPTEWYPTALAVCGNDLYIAAGKGRGSGPNSMTVDTGAIGGTKHPYIPTLLHGSLARVPIDDAMKRLDENTKAVEKANLLDTPPPRIPFKVAGNPVRHVIYIIKENRTYDQVLGDLKPGDGDASLCMYGADITPNEHALARQFGIIDNFYASGDVSGNGHNWSMSAITSDYLEKTWQINYSNSQRTYDYEGTVAGNFPLLLGIPDINEPASGYLWGNADTHSVTHRNYGEFVHTQWLSEPKGGAGGGSPESPQAAQPDASSKSRTHISKGDPLPPALGDPPGSPSPWPWDIPLLKENIASKPELRDHFDPAYPDFNLMVPDQLRADEFLREFHGFVAARSGENPEAMLPGLIIVRLGNDHTQGTKPGAPAPAAMVADNDLALGRIVDAVSHSPYWEDTAIFAVEDDAQNGADHVDAHRTTAYVISKYSPGTAEQPFIAHDFYTTVSMVHTIETLLGLPPMNHNDAYAPVMAPLFSGEGTQPPFTANTMNRDNGLLYQTNPPTAPGAKLSSAMDFSREDAINPAQLNLILWRDRMGHRPMPQPRHRFAFQDDD